MPRPTAPTRRPTTAALAAALLALTAGTPAPAQQPDAPPPAIPPAPPAAGERASDEPPPADNATTAERLPALIEALFGEDEDDADSARAALLLMELDHDALVALAAAAEGDAQLATARDIARHHVLTRLRHEELADLDDDRPLVGFRFQATATAGLVGPNTTELIEQYPHGAHVTDTTAGFPGYAYLRTGDMIVRVAGLALPNDRALAQQFLIDTVLDQPIDQPVAMTLIRDGRLVELRIPLARAAALPLMYDARTVTRELIDPFLFLWEEAWSTIRLDAGYDEDTPE